MLRKRFSEEKKKKAVGREGEITEFFRNMEKVAVHDLARMIDARIVVYEKKTI